MAPPPKPPAKQKVNYFFCQNPSCTYHASFIAKDTPAGMKAGAACPITPPDKLELIELETTAPLPPSTASGPPTGVALPVAPYGGLMLMFDDQDAAKTWEKTVQTDARHDGARYVAELQRDLLRLAFYSHGRSASSDENGKFTINVVSSVLDLKRHLSHFYGIGTSDKLADVKATAASGTGKIYYKELLNPSQVYNRFQTWQAALNRQGVPVTNKVKLFADDWEKRKKVGAADTLADLDQAERDLAAAKTQLAALKATPAPSEADVEGMADKIEPIEGRITADKVTSVKPVKKAAAGIAALEKKIAAIPDKLKKAREFVKKRDDALAVLLALFRGMKTEIDAAASNAKELSARPPESHSWTLPPTKVNLSNQKAAAVNQMTAWLKVDPDPKKSGLVTALRAQIDDLETRWKASAPPMPAPADWASLRAAALDLSTSVTAYKDAITSSDASTLFDNYRQQLREYAIVDGATARYIRQMVFTGVLANRGVFFNPMDGEIKEFDFSDLPAVIGEIIDELKLTARPAPANVPVVLTRSNTPIQLLEFIFGHESGKRHVVSWGSRKFVILGIDWENSDDRSNFEESNTSPIVWSASRGWGITQFTRFETGGGKTEVADDMDGTANKKYEMHSGIPYAVPGDTKRPSPTYIGSARDNLKIGVKLYLENFNGTSKHDCTFKTPFDCKSCVKNFDLVPEIVVDKTGVVSPHKHVSSITFDDAKNDFERVRSGKEGTGATTSYALKDVAKLRDLVQKGEYKLPGVDPTKDLTTQIGDDSRKEFPCSWVAAILRYSGSGDQAYWYCQEGLWTVKGKPLPPAPPPPAPPLPPLPAPTPPK